MKQFCPISPLSPPSDTLFGGADKSSMLFYNVRSLLPKVDECRQFVWDSLRPLTLGVTETWLNEMVEDGEIAVGAHTVYRKDRRGQGHGGGALRLESLEDRIWKGIVLKHCGLS